MAIAVLILGVLTGLLGFVDTIHQIYGMNNGKKIRVGPVTNSNIHLSKAEEHI